MVLGSVLLGRTLEARAGAAELALAHHLRATAETLAADRLVQLEQVLARERERAQTEAEAEARSQERDALRAGPGGDAGLADRLLDARDPGGAGPDSTTSGA